MVAKRQRLGVLHRANLVERSRIDRNHAARAYLARVSRAFFRTGAKWRQR